MTNFIIHGCHLWVYEDNSIFLDSKDPLEFQQIQSIISYCIQEGLLEMGNFKILNRWVKDE